MVPLGWVGCRLDPGWGEFALFWLPRFRGWRLRVNATKLGSWWWLDLMTRRRKCDRLGGGSNRVSVCLELIPGSVSGMACRLFG